jgi:hypothetical protein
LEKSLCRYIGRIEKCLANYGTLGLLKEKLLPIDLKRKAHRMT